MKIRAIRMKEVGRFSDPIALEGLSGELDVLAGPNELGKSTILKALRSALFDKYNSAKRELEALRPYAGGAPLVEVDFEIDGAPWRIRKQFLSARAAELRNLRSGSIARGGDAEAQLSELLCGEGRFNLLWITQGEPLAPLNPAETAGSSLMAAVEDEVESAADGGAARLVLAKLKQDLAELVTAHAPPRPAGRYKAALEERDALEQQRTDAESRLANAEARLERLQVIRQKLARLSDPAAASQRVEAAVAAARAFEQARSAREKCRHAEEALSTQEERLIALKTALEGIEGKISDLAKLQEAEAHELPALEEHKRSAGDGEVRVEACRRKRDELRAALQAAERQRKALELAGRLQEVSEHLEGARAAAAERKALSEALKANGADERLITAVRRKAQAVATTAARLSAAAPSVSIAYAEGAKAKIKVDGRALKHGETLSRARALALEIEGVGVVTVAPGQSASLAEDEAALAAHEKELGGLLRQMGVDTVEAAEQRAAERRGIEAKLAEAAANLKALAPEGLDRLERVHAELARQAAPEAVAATLADLEARTHDLVAELGAAEEGLAETTRAHTQVRVDLERLTTRSQERNERIAALIKDLGDETARAAKRETGRAALAEAEAARNKAVRDVAAWHETAPDEARLGVLQNAAEAAQAAQQQAERELNELRRTEAGIEGELKADRADDVESHLAEVQEACTKAQERVQSLQEEIAALQLLAGELGAAASETRERFAKPVMERLGPYFDLVFPLARAHFGEGFALDALERTNGAEALERLSEGTREQLAVLVRLGLGRLLAESGTPAPLILDDALVYTDDARIEQMFSALKLAARSYQVLVLTCRERTFASLGGHRVAIGAWQPE